MTKFVLHGGFNVEKASVHTHNCIKRVKNSHNKKREKVEYTKWT